MATERSSTPSHLWHCQDQIVGEASVVALWHVEHQVRRRLGVAAGTKTLW
jgi:hypothetical protein